MPEFDPDLHEKIGTYASPTFGYRMRDGVVEKQIFDGVLPSGWVDSPAHLEDFLRVSSPDNPLLKKSRGRPKGSKNRV